MSKRGRHAISNSGRTYWRSKGLCIDCGGEIDRPDLFVRCESCRRHRLDQQKARRAREEGAENVGAERTARADLAQEQPAAEPEARPESTSQMPYGEKLHFKAMRLQMERARREREKQLRRCEVCAFATYLGPGRLFCPMAVCFYENKLEG